MLIRIETVPGGYVTATDDGMEAAKLAKQGEAVIGILSKQDTDSPQPAGCWSGVSYFVTEPEALEDLFYVREAYCRFHGLPLRIAAEEGICLREMTVSDAPGIWKLYQDEAVRRFLPLPAKSVEELADRIDAYIHTIYRFYSCGIWVLEKEDTGEIIGRVGIEPQCGTAIWSAEPAFQDEPEETGSQNRSGRLEEAGKAQGGSETSQTPYEQYALEEAGKVQGGSETSQTPYEQYALEEAGKVQGSSEEAECQDMSGRQADCAQEGFYLGYLLLAPFRGQHLMERMCRLVLTDAAKRLELKRVYCRIAPDNQASIGLAGKLGFVPVSETLYQMDL